MYRINRPGRQPFRPGAPELYSGASGLVARVFDAVISPFAPSLVLRRQRARLESSALLNYDAARRSHQRRPMRAGSADEDLLLDLPEIRKNSRAMVRDDSAAAAMVRVLEDNVIGTGLVPQVDIDERRARLAGFTSSQADDFGRSAEQIFEEVSKHVDASEHDDFAALQRTGLRTLVMDGEILAHRVSVKDSDAPRILQTAFEVIDVDRLESPRDPRAREIRAGVEIGSRGNATAYYVLPHHPDDFRSMTSGAGPVLNEPKRIQRYQHGRPSVLHIFRRDRTGQHRGVPFFAPCFALVEAMNDMLETELQATRAASKFCAFIQQSMDANGMAGLSRDDEGQWHEELESATIRYLNEGEQFVPYSPNRPNQAFESFMTATIRSISSSIGLPWQLVMKDFSGMNYSNARVALLEARRGFEVLRQVMARQFCQPIFDAVVFEAVVSGLLPPPKNFLQLGSTIVRTYWQPPAWGWVDPVKEVQSSGMAIEQNLSSPQVEAARQGQDSTQLLRQRARHERDARAIESEFGLPEGQLTRAAVPQAPSGDGNNDYDDEAGEADKR